MNGNMLDYFNLANGSVGISISTPMASDDCFFAVLTDQGEVYTYKVLIKDFPAEGQNSTNKGSGISQGSKPNYQTLRSTQEKYVRIRDLFKNKTNITINENTQFK
mmetsp:Transcript_17559/g.16785  ORF Transcript_17559/g.16785 Transcript_17559/m.16785 type:complete len:105 (-) Transcript_17559:1346-1660(-)